MIDKYIKAMKSNNKLLEEFFDNRRTFIPSWSKQQFVKWAKDKYPHESKAHFQAMKKKQLIAIFANSK